ncbi:MAG TPA: tetratricopeptide repeat protein [Bryobacteraceae bacterium]|nr:tetratricopeptide repeat protein [Bryobacteraceae bacterium]
MIVHILTAALAAAAAQQAVETQDLSTAERALVTVVGRDSSGALRGRGIGVAVAPDGHILTSAHPLHGAAVVEVTTQGGGATFAVKATLAESVPAELVRLAVEPAGSLPHAVLSDQVPGSGQRLFLLIPGRRIEAVVQTARNISGLGTVLELSARAEGEPAGAPLADAEGRIAGMVLWRSRSRPDTYIAAAADLVQSLHPRQDAAGQHAKACGTHAEQLYREGVEQLVAQQFDEARRYFERATGSDPQCAPAWFHLGFAFAKLGRPEERVNAYRQAIAVKPDFAEAHYSLGVVYALANRRSDAVEEQKILEKLDADLAAQLAMLIEAVTHTEPQEVPETKTRI